MKIEEEETRDQTGRTRERGSDESWGGIGGNGTSVADEWSRKTIWHERKPKPRRKTYNYLLVFNSKAIPIKAHRTRFGHSWCIFRQRIAPRRIGEESGSRSKYPLGGIERGLVSSICSHDLNRVNQCRGRGRELNVECRCRSSCQWKLGLVAFSGR